MAVVRGLSTRPRLSSHLQTSAQLSGARQQRSNTNSNRSPSANHGRLLGHIVQQHCCKASCGMGLAARKPEAGAIMGKLSSQRPQITLAACPKLYPSKRQDWRQLLQTAAAATSSGPKHTPRRGHPHNCPHTASKLLRCWRLRSRRPQQRQLINVLQHVCTRWQIACALCLPALQRSGWKQN